MDGERWKIDHVYLMSKYLRGLNKIEYLMESFNCRPALSKSGIESMGYSTQKLSYVLHELFYKGGLIYCGNKVAYNNLRKISTPILSLKSLRLLALEKITRKKPAPFPDKTVRILNRQRHMG